MSKKIKPLPPKPLIKLDLSFGDLPQGCAFTRLNGKGPLEVPFDLPDNSVEEAQSFYALMRIPGRKRLLWADELWRVLVMGGKCTIVVPYWTHPKAVQHPETEMPLFSANSFNYFQRPFREANKEFSHIKCNFDVVYGMSFDAETANKNDETRAFWSKHYVNSVEDLYVTLIKKP